MHVFVTGPPAAGKTSLARPLAAELGFPLLSKDVVKEAIHDRVPATTPPEVWSRHLSEAAYAVLLALIPTVWDAVLDLNLPAEWADAFAAQAGPTAQIFCVCPRAELERRLVARATSRHPAHLDDMVLDEVRSEGVRGLAPAPLPGPLLEVDTEGPSDVHAVARWVRGLLPQA